MEAPNNNHKLIDLTKTFQVIGLIAIMSGLFGVGYQKGIIISMNIGNLSGSYEIREIFNSAVLGYLHVFKKFKWLLESCFRFFLSIKFIYSLFFYF